jgi:hypothetical protein
MTTPASPHEDHHRHRRRRATVDQTNATATGWGGLGVAHSSFPLPTREPDGTFHQVRFLPFLVRAGPVLRKYETNLQLGTVCRVRYSVPEIELFALLRRYVVRVIGGYRRLGAIYESHLQESCSPRITNTA